MKERTCALLQPKEAVKAELEELRQSYMDTLDKGASELRAVEMSIYDSRVKLEPGQRGEQQAASLYQTDDRRGPQSPRGQRQPKEAVKAELEELRQSYMDTLDK
ncbi:hypothetical protein L3Q82_019350, partial [Scortum barcoo]